jgi:predicted RNase H-like nuclease (RuvC/YqgF family)
MKNFFAIVKSKFNNIFPEADFTDETTESEVVDFLETQEGTLKAEVEEVKQETEGTKEKVEEVAAKSDDQGTALENLTEAVTKLTQAYQTQSQKMDSVIAKVNKLEAGKNLPSDMSGDDGPVEQVKGKENEFKIGSRSAEVLSAVKTLIPN